jgi:hypothetical protein
MKNIHEVLKQKEADIERLEKELWALRVVAPLLEEESVLEVQVAPPPMQTYPTPSAMPANGGGVVQLYYSPLMTRGDLSRPATPANGGGVAPMVRLTLDPWYETPKAAEKCAPSWAHR